MTVLVVFGILLRQPLIDPIHFGHRLADGDARLQADVRSQKVNATKLSGDWIDDSDRDPDIRHFSRHDELGGHYPDYRVSFTTQLNGFAENRRVAGKSLLPEAIRQHHDRRGADLVIIVLNCSADQSLGAEGL